MEKKEDKKKENMHIWQLLSTPPSSALTEIKGGRMAGKSDISPQWRYKVMTDVFGPCGVGWKYTIDKIGKSLTIAMVNPLNIEAVENVELITGCAVQAFVSTATEIKQAVEKYYKK